MAANRTAEVSGPTATFVARSVKDHDDVLIRFNGSDLHAMVELVRPSEADELADGIVIVPDDDDFAPGSVLAFYILGLVGDPSSFEARRSEILAAARAAREMLEVSR